MATYAIGDLQGCYDQLQHLLKKIQYHPDSDHLWFTGDIVNRGPQSLECLRFVAKTKNCQIVLGNHDLHCLVVNAGFAKSHPGDTLAPIYNAPDCDELLTWLTQQPLFFYDPDVDYCLIHAGILPAWDLNSAISYAKEAETALQNNPTSFLQDLYGHKPDIWNESLHGADRLRFIVNTFTRMRYCVSPIQLELTTKKSPQHTANELTPWFDIADRSASELNIIFGHWASLNCQVATPHIFALDSGCVWGGSLTAMRLEDGKRFSVPGLTSENSRGASY